MSKTRQARTWSPGLTANTGPRGRRHRACSLGTSAVVAGLPIPADGKAACSVPIPSAITFAFAGGLAGEGYLNIAGVIVVGTVAELADSLVAYSVGLIEVPPLLFGVLSLIGTAVWVTPMSLTGYGVGSTWHSIAHGVAVAGYVLVAVMVLAVAAFIASRLREARLEHRRAGRLSASNSGPPDHACSRRTAGPSLVRDFGPLTWFKASQIMGRQAIFGDCRA